MTNPKGVADHPAKDEIERLWEGGLRGKEIVSFLKEQGLPVVASSTINRYGQRYWSTVRIVTDGKDTLATLSSEIDSINASDVLL